MAGHSAGGQYVHRWTLLSSSPIIWGEDGGSGSDSVSVVHDDNNANANANANSTTTTNNREIEIRTAVANPRSYCYLDNRRMIRTDGNVIIFIIASDKITVKTIVYYEYFPTAVSGISYKATMK